MENETLIIILLGAILLIAILAVLYFLFGRKNESEIEKIKQENLLNNIGNLEHKVVDVFRNLENKIHSSEREMRRMQDETRKSQELQFEGSLKLIQDISERISNSERESRKSAEMQFQNSQKLISEISEKMRVGDLETRKAFSEQFDSSKRLIQEITKEITEVKEGNKQVLEMTDQLSNLEKVLTNQKQRGNWGESSLDLILSNFVPNHYQMQYSFANGETVDAVINIKDKILPIDSKFSLDNYERCINAETDEDKKYYGEEFKKDLKNRITETAKYIRESENTLSIAFMFIPSEAIYYDLLAGEQSRLKINTQALMEFAQKNKVFIVSPTSILAYIHLVLSGIKAFKIEEGAKEIQKKVEDLGRHIQKFEEGYKKIGNSLSATVNHYNQSYVQLANIDKDVYKITDGTEGKKILTAKVDKPSNDE
jgi:DNA recombination protein RmuC